MAAIFAGLASLIIPGLGQLINGAWVSGILWFIAGAVVPGIVNILSAIHAVVVSQERDRGGTRRRTSRRR